MVDTFIALFETLYNFSDFFYSAFKQYMVLNKQNAGCSQFLGHSVYAVVEAKEDRTFDMLKNTGPYVFIWPS